MTKMRLPLSAFLKLLLFLIQSGNTQIFVEWSILQHIVTEEA